MKSTKPEVSVRHATIDDLPAIGDIYNYYIFNSTCTFDLEQKTEQEFGQWFSERSSTHPVLVAELDGNVAGWGALSPWKSRRAYVHSVEASVYVHHESHRKGIGREILVDLINRAREIGHHTILGGACTEHPASLALQETLGFERVGCLKEVGYKFGRWLDVEYTQLKL